MMDLVKQLVSLHEKVKPLLDEYEALRSRVERVMAASGIDQVQVDGYTVTRVTAVRATPRSDATEAILGILRKFDVDVSSAIQVRSGFLSEIASRRPEILPDLAEYLDISKSSYVTVRKTA
jgi:hypothetical protein